MTYSIMVYFTFVLLIQIWSVLNKEKSLFIS